MPKTKNVQIAKLQRNFTIAKVFLAITPFIAYLYVSLAASARNITFQEILQTMPSVTVIFLLAMVNAYVGYLLHLSQGKLEKGEFNFVVINLLLLLIAQLLTGNIVYCLMIGWLLYSTKKVYNLNLLEIIKETSMKARFSLGGGSMLVMLFSSICLIITLKI